MGGEPNWLNEDEDRAWRAYRSLQSLLAGQLRSDLVRDSGLSDPDYEVLSTLSEKPSQRWNLHELAAKMLWSRSRLSHHIARMERRGLVARQDDPDDRRGCILVLTRSGLRTLQEAAPLHVASVRKHFLDLMSESELAVLTAIAERVVEQLGRSNAG